MTEYRIENKKDYYETLEGFYKGHDFDALPFHTLPESIYVVSISGIDIYAIPVYKTDSALAWLAFPVSNPEVSGYEKNTFSGLIGFIGDKLEEEGYSIIFTTSGIPRLQDKLIMSDFQEGDLNINQYFKLI